MKKEKRLRWPSKLKACIHLISGIVRGYILYTVVPRLMTLIHSSKIAVERNPCQAKIKNPLKYIENRFNTFQWAKYLIVQQRFPIGQPFSGACKAKNAS